jgi:hypothetical protein
MGYLNTESEHVQFFRLGQIRRLFAAAGFAIAESRGKVVLCGPYADWWLQHLSFGGRTYRLNGDLADRLPLTWAAGWMFRLRRAAF